MKNHYYLISASHKCKNGDFGVSSFTVTQEEEGEYTSKSTIDYLIAKARKKLDDNGVNAESVMILSISYLGYMTNDEFNDNQPSTSQPHPSQT